MPKVSVYTQIYNTPEAYVRRCMESVLNQTFTDFKYIVIDNGCTDGSAEIIEEYASKDQRIRAIHFDENENIPRWLDDMRHNLAEEYVTILDSDDWWEPDYLERLLKAAEETDADIVCAGALMHSEETGKITSRVLPRRLCIPRGDFAALYPNYHVFLRTVWGKLYRREVFLKANIPDFRNLDLIYGGDTLDTFAVLRQSERLVIDDSAPYHYLLRKHSLSYQYDPHRFDSDIYLYHDALDFLSDYGPISDKNRAFLADVYSNAVRDTVGVVNHAKLSKQDKLREYRRLAEHPVTTENFRFASGDVLRARKSLLAGALSCHDAEGETAAEDFRAILALCAPKCAAALTPESVSLLAQNNLLNALLDDDAGALLAALLGMIRASENSKKYDLCAMVRALSADKPLLKDVGEKKFLRRYGDIYLAVWRDDHGTALKEMTELLLKGEKTDEAFLQLYLTLAALHELTEAFVFGKKKLAACRLRAGDKEGCRAVLDELAEMGAGNDPELESLRAKL